MQAYIAGALTGQGKELKNFYEVLGTTCEQAGIKPYIPHKMSDPIINHSLSPLQVFNMDIEQIIHSEILTAYIGEPSTGVGVELGFVAAWNMDELRKDKIVLLLYEHGKVISRLPRGIPRAKHIVFKDYSDAAEQLKLYLQEIKNALK